jgi:hypothetical protein
MFGQDDDKRDQICLIKWLNTSCRLMLVNAKWIRNTMIPKKFELNSYIPLRKEVWPNILGWEGEL